MKLGKFKVAIIGLLMMLGRGNRKGIVWTREEPMECPGEYVWGCVSGCGWA